MKRKCANGQRNEMETEGGKREREAGRKRGEVGEETWGRRGGRQGEREDAMLLALKVKG